MALNTLKCNHLTPLGMKGLKVQFNCACFQTGETSANFGENMEKKKKEEIILCNSRLSASKEDEHYSSAVTVVVNHDHVSTQGRNTVEHLVTVTVETAVGQLALNTERLSVLLSLVSNKMILAEESLVTVFILTQKTLLFAVSHSPTTRH